MEHVAAPSRAMLAYLVSGVLCILALRGLSSPGTSRAGNRYGMVGMLIAVVTTLVTHQIASLPEIVVAIAIGGGIGWIIARRIAMTEPEKVIAPIAMPSPISSRETGLIAPSAPTMPKASGFR